MEFSLNSDAEFTFPFQFQRKLRQNLRSLGIIYIILYLLIICNGCSPGLTYVDRFLKIYNFVGIQPQQ